MKMSPIMQQHSLPYSSSSPNFFVHNYVNEVSNSNRNWTYHQRSTNWNLDFVTLLTSNSPEQKRLGKLTLPQLVDSLESRRKFKSVDNMKLTGGLNDQHSSSESLSVQQSYGADNYYRTLLQNQRNNNGLKTEVALVHKLDYDYKREQKCLLELKDKITEVEEEYNEIVSQQKEKERRLKERVQKLKKRFQLVVKFHSYLTKSLNHNQQEATVN